MLAVYALSAALTGPALTRPAGRMSPATMREDAAMGRRSALLAAAATALPLAAHAATYADLGGANSGVDYTSSVEDDIAAIAKRTTEKNLAEKKRIQQSYKPKTAAELQDDQNKAKLAIGAIAGGGTLISAYFFKDNLARLLIKVKSGGADAGYDTLAKRKAKKAPKKAAKKELVGASTKSGPFGLF